MRRRAAMRRQGDAYCYNGEMNTVGGFPSGQDIFDTTGPCVISGTTATCPDKRGAPNVYAFNLSGNQFTSPISCSGGMAMAQGGTTYKTSWTLQCYTGSGGSSPSGPESVEAATASVPASVLASPVDPGLLTNIINQRWQAAASQPGYQGLPYQASNPVTATDVATWQALNPNAYPTVQDVLAPISPSAATGTVGTVSVPDASVSGSTAPATNAGTNPGTGNQVNLGPDPDPGIGSPSLENTPTMTQILAPLVGVFPGLRSFVMPSHTSTCPTPTFEAFGHIYTIQAHCTILSQNAATIQTAMIAFWTLAALLIILAA